MKSVFFLAILLASNQSANSQIISPYSNSITASAATNFMQPGIIQQLNFFGGGIGIGYMPFFDQTQFYSQLPFAMSMDPMTNAGSFNNNSSFYNVFNPVIFSQAFQPTLRSFTELKNSYSKIDDSTTEVSEDNENDHKEDNQDSDIKDASREVAATDNSVELCEQHADMIWMADKSICSNITETQCNETANRVWLESAGCSFKSEIKEEDCKKNTTKLSWIGEKCVSKPANADDCKKNVGTIWGTDSLCYEVTKLTADTCTKIPNRNWDGKDCVEKVIESPAQSKVEIPKEDTMRAPDGFSLELTGEANFLNSSRKTDNSIPNAEVLETCLQNLDDVADNNINYSRDEKIYSFRDNKGPSIGVTVVEKDVPFFVEDREIIKLRDTFCKKERDTVAKAKKTDKINYNCSFNIHIGQRTYGVVIDGENLLYNKPDYSLTDDSGTYDTDYKAQKKKMSTLSYKNLYLNIEQVYANVTSEINEQCLVDPKKITGDFFSSKALNFAGACEAVLISGWSDKDVNSNIADDLRKALSNCRMKTHVHNKSDDAKNSNQNK